MHIFSCERTILQEETRLRPVSTIPPLHVPFTQLSSADNQPLRVNAPGILPNRKHRFGPRLTSRSCLTASVRRDPRRVIFRKAVDVDAHPLGNIRSASMWQISPLGSGLGNWTQTALLHSPRPAPLKGAALQPSSPEVALWPSGPAANCREEKEPRKGSGGNSPGSWLHPPPTSELPPITHIVNAVCPGHLLTHLPEFHPGKQGMNFGRSQKGHPVRAL